MKVAVIQASTQVSKNQIIFEETQKVALNLGHEVINFGLCEDSPNMSYIQVSLAVALLLNSQAVDFVITGAVVETVWLLLVTLYQM
ncbi:galactose-6-phosphate isomerase [Floricoccus penangensis]|uniref:galactose-6-phosphate isomerase n=1 Tax=Floricoccus penangensis TaxID=1859475 RepID=UPI0026BF31D3